MQITPYPDTPILTLNRTGVMVVMLGEGGVTVERVNMMAEALCNEPIALSNTRWYSQGNGSFNFIITQ